MRGEQKSAEATVVVVHGDEGPNTRSRTGRERSIPEGGAAKRAGMPERAQRVGGGTAEGMGIARQAGAAREGYAGEGASMLEHRRLMSTS